MNRIDIDAIEQAARAATPGPWRTDDGVVVVGADDSIVCEATRALHDDFPFSCSTPNGEFIATSNPAAVLVLCAELRAARAVVEAVKDNPERSTPIEVLSALDAYDAANGEP